ncbi:hypothetical protein AAEO56_12780 [Flavobacterium sp. DGU11]|uniref:Uncharacterized protein n=1 Tax=Flavobacterium arundinis TaxID=3139143 RepID=A0ABU9HYC3_9FLAO
MKNLLDKYDCLFPLNQGSYYINDDRETKKAVFVKEDERWTLLIDNQKATIHFMQNEGCIMLDNAIKKCDWICFDDERFYFIEAKDVRPGQRKSERKGAKEKFEGTLKFYKEELGFSLDNFTEVYAILNFRNTNRITSAASKENKAHYKETFGVTYEETNSIEFN